MDDSRDPSCDLAHGTAPVPAETRTLAAVFASPVATYLLRFGSDAGFRTLLIEPDKERWPAPAGEEVVSGVFEDVVDATTDVVVTDHHRPELGIVLRDALASPARWVGIMGNPRHPGAHVSALAALGVPAAEVARVHRPIGLNIGSHTPAEIALATVAGLIADRNQRPGGFVF